jgi:AcrR family transcriptional regulator
VSVLAARAGITRPTLYRNYPALIDKFLTAATDAATTQRTGRPRQSRNTDQLHERITKLRNENQQLRLHLDLYEEHIRRLTIDNDKLRTEVSQATGVTTIIPSNHANRRS